VQVRKKKLTALQQAAAGLFITEQAEGGAEGRGVM